MNNKIDICHYPPGNPENVQWISISESAWKAHEAHGDHRNKEQCNFQPPSTTTVSTVPSTTTVENSTTSTTSPSNTISESSSTTVSPKASESTTTVSPTSSENSFTSVLLTVVPEEVSGSVHRDGTVPSTEAPNASSQWSSTIPVSHTGTLPATGNESEVIGGIAAVSIAAGVILLILRKHFRVR